MAPNKEGVAQALALGITETIIATFPELQAVFDLFAEGNIADARIAYFNTPYYKDLTSNSQLRKSRKETAPGVYAQEFDAWRQAQRVRLIAKGFMYTPEIEAKLEESYLRGDSDQQVEITILNSGLMGSNIGGSALGTVNSLKTYAADQGVDGILPRSYWDKISMGIIGGTLTRESVEEELKGFSISAYPAYAEGIKAGRSFYLQTSASRQQMANLYEVDVDTITNDNPIFKEMTTYINPKTGLPEQMGLWKEEKFLKGKDEWLYKKNAQKTFDDLGLKVLRDMGLA